MSGPRQLARMGCGAPEGFDIEFPDACPEGLRKPPATVSVFFGLTLPSGLSVAWRIWSMARGGETTANGVAICAGAAIGILSLGMLSAKPARRMHGKERSLATLGMTKWCRPQRLATRLNGSPGAPRVRRAYQRMDGVGPMDKSSPPGPGSIVEPRIEGGTRCFLRWSHGP